MSRASRKAVKPYAPAEVELRIYRRWERAGAFRPRSDVEVRPRRRRGLTSRPFVMVIPLPNITGSLHMGHALQHTLMDVLTRYHRMRGDDALLVPGTDHAGIATQNVVEKELRKEGKTRADLGREKFVERVWQWKERYGGIIDGQMRKLGDSCDWTRYHFTMDDSYARAVQEAFIHYARKGLIYRGERLVNWCPRCASSISDLEVKHEEREGRLYYVRYPLVSSLRAKRSNPDEITSLPAAPRNDLGSVIVVTTRPETMLGDTAVAVHPDDERYDDLIGQSVRLPIAERDIPVVADRAVDRAFGTGAVKVTPAHDAADAEIGERHGLPVRNVIGDDGRMTGDIPERYRGLRAGGARERIVAELRAAGLVEKEEPIRHRVALCERCGTDIQPLVSKQWFVRMASLAEPAIDVVERGLVRFHPPRWRKATLDWLRNVKDWCISRQLWWGHQLPVWYCSEDGEVAASDDEFMFSIAEPKKCGKCGRTKFVQDPDVLDTWFSSALWPFAVFGWPEATADLRRFYPTSVLTTAPEILYLWVARMVFSGLEFLDGKKYLPARNYGKRTPEKRVPFRDVLIHPTVLMLSGERMSKSKGIFVDPVDLIARYGADAVRFGILLQLHEGQQALRFDENAVRAARNFVNKLWNIGRFLDRSSKRSPGLKPQAPTPFDQWILSRLADTARTVAEELEGYRLGEAARTLHDFIWDDLADWYVEASKVPGMTDPGVARAVFQDTLRLLHPFIPFVTEKLWETSGDGTKLLVVAPWPAATEGTWGPEPKARRLVARFQQVVRDIRSARTLLGIAPSQKLRVRVPSQTLRPLFPALGFLGGCSEVALAEDESTWMRLPGTGSVPVGLHREALSGVDFGGRLSAAEKRGAELRAAVAAVERRLSAMRGKAPQDAIGEQKRSLAEQRALLAQHEESTRALKDLAQGAPPR